MLSETGLQKIRRRNYDMKRKEYGTKGKVYLSLAIAKFIKGAIRLLRHGGTVLPGEVALRFSRGCPPYCHKI